MTMAATDKHLAYWRMRNVRLTGPPLPSPEAVVSWLGAVQSQDYGPAKWSLGQRVNGFSDAAIDRAFADGTILRTHVLRPTWHFVAPADIRWMLALTAPRVHQSSAYYYRQLDLDSGTLERCSKLLTGFLQGGITLTRKVVAERLAGGGIEAAGPRLGYILMYAELNGVVCSGPLKGKQHTYALLDERVPPAEALSYEAALARLTPRRAAQNHRRRVDRDDCGAAGRSGAHGPGAARRSPRHGHRPCKPPRGA